MRTYSAFLAFFVPALLAGCGGAQSPAIPEAPSANLQAHSGSWMLPEAKGEDLLYVTNYSDVLVFSYPEDKLVGTLKGFVSAAGECVDSKGDVFVTNFEPVTVYEYAHGSAKRTASFPTKKAGTYGCAINPLNGDLAITGATSYAEIYKGAQRGKPVAYKDTNMLFGQFCTYDDKGNLFFNGINMNREERLSELPAGTTKFVGITVKPHFQYSASIQWDGQYVTALSYVPWKSPKERPVLFQLRIANNKHGAKAGQVPLGNPANEIVQFFITNGTVVVPNLRGTSGQNSTVLLYNYPSGGGPYATITKRITDARGVVVSYASPR